MKTLAKLALAWTLFTAPLPAAELKILAWNVESGDPTPQNPSQGNDPITIANELKEMPGYDIVGLSEVKAKNIKRYVDALSAAGDTFLSIHSSTGRDDRLVLAYNNTKVQLLSGYEMHRFSDFQLNDYRENGIFRYRSPLVGQFRDRATGTEFLVTVNHLARGDKGIRQRQATGLRNWAKEQSLPIFGIGDFNFDYDFHSNQGNEAFKRFLQHGVWKWAKPAELIDTNWSDNNPRLPLEQRTDKYPDSCLDFIFVAGPAKKWQVESKVIIRPGDFPDSVETSDHRPVEGFVVLPSI